MEDPGRDLGRYAVKHAGDGYSLARTAWNDLPPLDESTLNKLGEYAVAWRDLRRARKSLIR